MEYILQQVEPENPHPVIICLDKDEIIVGRKTVVAMSKCHLVSRKHASFLRIKDNWYVKDLGSLNDLYVNAIKVGSSLQKLEVGDTIGFGIPYISIDGGFLCVLKARKKIKQEPLPSTRCEPNFEEIKLSSSLLDAPNTYIKEVTTHIVNDVENTDSSTAKIQQPESLISTDISVCEKQLIDSSLPHPTSSVEDTNNCNGIAEEPSQKQSTSVSESEVSNNSISLKNDILSDNVNFNPHISSPLEKTVNGMGNKISDTTAVVLADDTVETLPTLYSSLLHFEKNIKALTKTDRNALYTSMTHSYAIQCRAIKCEKSKEAGTLKSLNSQNSVDIPNDSLPLIKDYSSLNTNKLTSNSSSLSSVVSKPIKTKIISDKKMPNEKISLNTHKNHLNIACEKNNTFISLSSDVKDSENGFKKNTEVTKGNESSEKNNLPLKNKCSFEELENGFKTQKCEKSKEAGTLQSLNFSHNSVDIPNDSLPSIKDYRSLNINKLTSNSSSLSSVVSKPIKTKIISDKKIPNEIKISLNTHKNHLNIACEKKNTFISLSSDVEDSVNGFKKNTKGNESSEKNNLPFKKKCSFEELENGFKTQKCEKSKEAGTLQSLNFSHNSVDIPNDSLPSIKDYSSLNTNKLTSNSSSLSSVVSKPIKTKIISDKKIPNEIKISLNTHKNHLNIACEKENTLISLSSDVEDSVNGFKKNTEVTKGNESSEKNNLPLKKKCSFEELENGFKTQNNFALFNSSSDTHIASAEEEVPFRKQYNLRKCFVLLPKCDIQNSHHKSLSLNVPGREKSLVAKSDMSDSGFSYHFKQCFVPLLPCDSKHFRLPPDIRKINLHSFKKSKCKIVKGIKKHTLKSKHLSKNEKMLKPNKTNMNTKKNLNVDSSTKSFQKHDVFFAAPQKRQSVSMQFEDVMTNGQKETNFNYSQNTCKELNGQSSSHIKKKFKLPKGKRTQKEDVIFSHNNYKNKLPHKKLVKKAENRRKKIHSNISSQVFIDLTESDFQENEGNDDILILDNNDSTINNSTVFSEKPSSYKKFSSTSKITRAPRREKYTFPRLPSHLNSGMGLFDMSEPNIKSQKITSKKLVTCTSDISDNSSIQSISQFPLQESSSFLEEVITFEKINSKNTKNGLPSNSSKHFCQPPDDRKIHLNSFKKSKCKIVKGINKHTLKSKHLSKNKKVLKPNMTNMNTEENLNVDSSTKWLQRHDVFLAAPQKHQSVSMQFEGVITNGQKETNSNYSQNIGKELNGQFSSHIKKKYKLPKKKQVQKQDVIFSSINYKNQLHKKKTVKKAENKQKKIHSNILSQVFIDLTQSDFQKNEGNDDILILDNDSTINNSTIFSEKPSSYKNFSSTSKITVAPLRKKYTFPRLPSRFTSRMGFLLDMREPNIKSQEIIPKKPVTFTSDKSDNSPVQESIRFLEEVMTVEKINSKSTKNELQSNSTKNNNCLNDITNNITECIVLEDTIECYAPNTIPLNTVNNMINNQISCENGIYRPPQIPPRMTTNRNIAVVLPYASQMDLVPIKNQCEYSYKYNTISCIKKIVEWNPKWLGEQMRDANLFSIITNKSAHLNHSFESFEDYFSTFSSASVLDIFMFMCNEESKYKSSCKINDFYCIVTSVIEKNGMTELECVAAVKDSLSYYPKEGSVVLLEIYDTKFKVNTEVFGYVIRCKIDELNDVSESRKYLVKAEKVPHAKLWKFDLYIKSQIVLEAKTLMLAHGICNIKDKLRSVDALCIFQFSPFKNLVLQPNRANFLLNDDFPSEEGYSNFITSVRDNIMNVHSPTKAILIQGGPGTGKTHSILELLEKLLFYSTAKIKILVSAPSNAAVDEIGLRLIELNERRNWKCKSVKFIRTGNPKNIHPKLRSYVLNEKVAKMCISHCQKDLHTEKELKRIECEINKLYQDDRTQSTFSKLNDLQTLTEKYRRLSNQYERELNKIAQSVECLCVGNDCSHLYCSLHTSCIQYKSSIIEESDVILSTLNECVQFGVNLISSQSCETPFTVCIVDAADRCSEAEMLQCLTLGVNKLILVGDLLPKTDYETANRFWYKRSMFERFQIFFKKHYLESPIFTLNEQYRMHSSICNFPSTYFYNKRLLTPSAVDERYKLFPLKSYIVLDVIDDQYLDICDGTDCDQLVLTYVCSLIKQSVPPTTVGIITVKSKVPIYGACLSENALCKEIEVKTIDYFHSKEKDVIVIPCVHPFKNAEADDFIFNDVNLSVALTRARQTLFIYGHISSLSHHKYWRALLEDAKSRNIYTSVSSLMHIPLVLNEIIVKPSEI